MHLLTTGIFCSEFVPFFTDEDLKLGSTLFHWPTHINNVFEVAANRIDNRRTQAEEELRARVKAFEEKLHDYMKEVESFRKREIMSMDEMRVSEAVELQ